MLKKTRMMNTEMKTVFLTDSFGAPYGTKYYHDPSGTWGNKTWVAGSCGVRFIGNPESHIDLRRPHVGVKIVRGIVAAPCQHPAYTIHNIKTKNGDLTISLRKKRGNYVRVG